MAVSQFGKAFFCRFRPFGDDYSTPFEPLIFIAPVGEVILYRFGKVLISLPPDLLGDFIQRIEA